ncbi:hypothetical protein ACFL3S_09040 [Gemmatimonadota bacterium]
MKCRSIRGMAGHEVAREVVLDAGKDLLLVGAGFVLLLVLAQAWPGVGVWGRWVFVLAAAVLTIQFLISCLINLADSVLDGMRGPDLEGSGWLVLAMAIRLAEVSLVLWMAFFLFRRFG